MADFPTFVHYLFKVLLMSMKDTHMHALSGRAAIVFFKGYTGISPVCIT